jgi:hypothetical protein
MTARPLAANVVTARTSWEHLADVEHALEGVGPELPDRAWVFTHEVRHPAPHYAVSACSVAPLPASALDALERRLGARPGPPAADDPAWLQLLAGDGPRAVRFPGQDGARGELTVRDLLARTAIEDVPVLGGTAVAPHDVVVTRDFLRPLLRAGRLVLPVLPAGLGCVAPFEVPDPTPCCGERPAGRAVSRPTVSSS